MIRDQFLLDMSHELIVDNFASGGGASCGIELALGRHVDIAHQARSRSGGHARYQPPPDEHHIPLEAAR